MSKALRVTVTKTVTYTLNMFSNVDEDLLDQVIEGIEDGYEKETSVLWRIEKVEEI